MRSWRRERRPRRTRPTSRAPPGSSSRCCPTHPTWRRSWTGRTACSPPSSTIAPAAARRLAENAAAHGASYLDAPVSGGEIGAIEGTLTFMVGGEEAVLDGVRPVLEAMGRADRIVHIGPSGAGQICKVCNQLVIGGTMSVVAEAIALTKKAGVDGAKVRQALLGGFAASRVLEVHGERMLSGNYKPGFKARLFKKDLRIAAETLAAHDVAAPATALVQQLVHALVASGHGEDDYSGVARVVFDLAGVDEKGN
jgi:3-hydroxyisobutyrate dehydrogenase-like beta-hydroxyacid dehydrogenase